MCWKIFKPLHEIVRMNFRAFQNSRSAKLKQPSNVSCYEIEYSWLSLWIICSLRNCTHIHGWKRGGYITIKRGGAKQELYWNLFYMDIMYCFNYFNWGIVAFLCFHTWIVSSSPKPRLESKAIVWYFYLLHSTSKKSSSMILFLKDAKNVGFLWVLFESLFILSFTSWLGVFIFSWPSLKSYFCQ